MIGFTGEGELKTATSMVSPGPFARLGKLGSALKPEGAPTWQTFFRSLSAIQPEGMGSKTSASSNASVIIGYRFYRFSDAAR